MIGIIALKEVEGTFPQVRITRVEFFPDQEAAWKSVWERISIFLISHHYIPGVAACLFEPFIRRAFISDGAISIGRETHGEGIYVMVDASHLGAVELGTRDDIRGVLSMLEDIEEFEEDRIEGFNEDDIIPLRTLAIKTYKKFYGLVDSAIRLRKEVRETRSDVKEMQRKLETLRNENADDCDKEITRLEITIPSYQSRLRQAEDRVKNLSSTIANLRRDVFSSAKESEEQRKALRTIQGSGRDLSAELQMNRWFIHFVQEQEIDPAPFIAKADEIEARELNRFNDTLQSLREERFKKISSAIDSSDT